MTASLAKKIRDLEAAFWSQAEHIKMPDDEVVVFWISLHPLGIPIFISWYADDPEPQRIDRRTERIEKSLPPVHPAFFRNEREAVRRAQWSLHKSAEYRRLAEDYWNRFLEYARARYDPKDGGLLGVALRLFEKEIDLWVAEREYLGLEWSREELASDMIELWKIIERERDKAGKPIDEKANAEIWNRAFIEHVREVYGREITEEDLDFDRKMWSQLSKDMESGKPASESEAARYLRDLFERYPRNNSADSR